MIDQREITPQTKNKNRDISRHIKYIDKYFHPFMLGIRIICISYPTYREKTPNCYVIPVGVRFANKSHEKQKINKKFL